MQVQRPSPAIQLHNSRELDQVSGGVAFEISLLKPSVPQHTKYGRPCSFQIGSRGVFFTHKLPTLLEPLNLLVQMRMQ
jgi:hypothetical protein